MKKYSIYFDADKDLLEIMKWLQTFYGIKSRKQLIEQIMIIHCINIAALENHPEWNGMTRKAWQFCKKIRKEIAELLVIKTMKSMMKENLEVMSFEELRAFAKSQSISTQKNMTREQIIKKIGEDFMHITIEQIEEEIENMSPAELERMANNFHKIAKFAVSRTLKEVLIKELQLAEKRIMVLEKNMLGTSQESSEELWPSFSGEKE